MTGISDFNYAHEYRRLDYETHFTLNIKRSYSMRRFR